MVVMCERCQTQACNAYYSAPNDVTGAMFVFIGVIRDQHRRYNLVIISVRDSVLRYSNSPEVHTEQRSESPSMTTDN